MKTVTRTALANVRQNRGRNILCGAAIFLTTLLIFLVLTIGWDMVELDKASTRSFYPSYHALFRQVSEEHAEALKAHGGMEAVGLREDAGAVNLKGADGEKALLTAMDAAGLEMNRIETSEGRFPKEKNEIAVTRTLPAKLGLLDVQVGDEITLPYQIYEKNGMGYETEAVFKVAGFLDVDEEADMEGNELAFCTIDWMKETVPEEDREYRVMFRLAEADDLSVEQIEDEIWAIASDFGVPETDILKNSNYLRANYVEYSFYAGILLCVALVAFIGVMTIYGVYYVSMIPRIQEYGKLKAMGATKRQIRQIIFREGGIVLAVSLPFGILVGSLLVKPIITILFENAGIASGNGEQALVNLARELLRNGGIPLLHVWVYGLTAAVVLLTVYLALLKPMHTGAKISPVEAMRYQEAGNGRRAKKGRKEKRRKGYTNVNIFRLVKANLSRTGRRTLFTMVSLGAIGILFMALATVLACGDPEGIAKREIASDYRITVDSWSGDKMNPDREWGNLMKEELINDGFIERIKAVSGVEKVAVNAFLNGVYPELDPKGEIAGASLTGLDDYYAEELEDAIVEGDVTWEELETGENKVVLSDTFRYWFPEVKVGDTVKASFDTAGGPVEKDLEVAAAADGTFRGVSENLMFLPKSVLETWTPYDLDNTCDVYVEEDKKGETYENLDALTNISEYLSSQNYDDVLAEWKSAMGLITAIVYGFLAVVGGIGFTNLVNTMITSIYTRKKELGLLQAMGLSGRQTVRMIQIEGMIYAAGTLLISLGLGSLAGYGVFLYAKGEGLLNITTFHYPVLPAVILAAAVLLVQLFLVYAISGSLKKESLIDRIRYSE